MSIVSFHRILIGTAIAFCVLFSLYEGARFLADGHPVDAVLGVAFASAALALGFYLARLRRFLGEEPSSR